MRIIFIILITAFFISSATSQSAKQLKEIEEQYAFNIQQTHINDVYIPEGIEDAMTEIDRLSNDAGRAKFLETDEDNAANVLVKGLGRWMIVNWNFYDGSRLSHYLKGLGVSHPEDMAKFLIVSYHRHLRGVPQELEARAKIFELQRKEDQEKRKAELRRNSDLIVLDKDKGGN